jgi:hypothetical protein
MTPETIADKIIFRFIVVDFWFKIFPRVTKITALNGYCLVFCIKSAFPTCGPLPGIVSRTITESFISLVESGIASNGDCSGRVLQFRIWFAVITGNYSRWKARIKKYLFIRLCLALKCPATIFKEQKLFLKLTVGLTCFSWQVINIILRSNVYEYPFQLSMSFLKLILILMQRSKQRPKILTNSFFIRK